MANGRSYEPTSARSENEAVQKRRLEDNPVDIQENRLCFLAPLVVFPMKLRYKKGCKCQMPRFVRIDQRRV